MLTRRGFLKNSGLALFGVSLGGLPSFLARATEIQKNRSVFQRSKTLVCLFQRGAMDGLMAVSPFRDPFFKDARPNLYMSAAKSEGSAALLDLDGTFGLHPSMSALESLFKEENLAIVHGIGSPNTTRSHFDAQDYMESGTPFKKGTSSGWLNRAVGLMGHEASTPFQSVSITAALPRSLYGSQSAICMSSLKDFKVQSNSKNTTAKSFEELYDLSQSALLKETSKETFEATKLLQKTETQKYIPSDGAIYPNSSLGNALKQIAQLIKMKVGLEVAFAESGGWDTHYNQGKNTGIFALNAKDLSNSIAAFWADLGTLKDDVTLMTMTEFGRTVHQNGTGGTDHGRASCNFILGHNVQGGKVYADLPNLAKENLEDGRDLPVIHDFRSVFSSVAQQHLQIEDIHTLFPGWEGKNLNVMT